MTHEQETDLKARVNARLAPFEDPLIDRIVYWIDANDLWAACEQVGMVKASYGKIITKEQIVSDLVAVLESHL